MRPIFVVFLYLLITSNATAAAKIERCARPDGYATPDALALSGGGYRAMLFHVGALWRMNELGCLANLQAISSVSGGSIVAGLLASRWTELKFDHKGVASNFREVIAEPLLELAGATIADWRSIAYRVVTWRNANNLVEAAYDKLYKGKTLGDLPDIPEFIFNAVNIQTGVIWDFRKRHSGDAVLGRTASKAIPIAVAVAASSAFPPYLSPHRLKIPDPSWQINSKSGPSLHNSEALKEFQKQPLLTDGGIIDNLGLEALFHTDYVIFASDGGARFVPSPNPPTDWVRQAKHIVDIIHGQHDILRARSLMERFKSRRPDGIMWTIQSAACHTDVFYNIPVAEETRQLSGLPTELSAMEDFTKKRLVNWGYLSMDRSLPYLDRAWPMMRANTDWSSDVVQPFPDHALTLGMYEGCPHKRHRQH
jgi:NTE family protein